MYEDFYQTCVIGAKMTLSDEEFLISLFFTCINQVNLWLFFPQEPCPLTSEMTCINENILFFQMAITCTNFVFFFSFFFMDNIDQNLNCRLMIISWHFGFLVRLIHHICCLTVPILHLYLFTRHQYLFQNNFLFIYCQDFLLQRYIKVSMTNIWLHNI